MRSLNCAVSPGRPPGAGGMGCDLSGAAENPLERRHRARRSGGFDGITSGLLALRWFARCSRGGRRRGALRWSCHRSLRRPVSRSCRWVGGIARVDPKGRGRGAAFARRGPEGVPPPDRPGPVAEGRGSGEDRCGTASSAVARERKGERPQGAFGPCARIPLALRDARGPRVSHCQVGGGWRAEGSERSAQVCTGKSGPRRSRRSP